MLWTSKYCCTANSGRTAVGFTTTDVAVFTTVVCMYVLRRLVLVYGSWCRTISTLASCSAKTMHYKTAVSYHTSYTYIIGIICFHLYHTKLLYFTPDVPGSDRFKMDEHKRQQHTAKLLSHTPRAVICNRASPILIHAACRHTYI